MPGQAQTSSSQHSKAIKTRRFAFVLSRNDVVEQCRNQKMSITQYHHEGKGDKACSYTLGPSEKFMGL